MIAIGIACSLLLAPARGIDITYRDGAFFMSDPQGRRKVLIDPPSAHRDVFALKHKSTWMVWDSRGLTVRTGDKASSSRFPFIPTSPKVLSKEQILETINKLDQGVRQREASGLSGAQLVGDTVYFLVRWEEGDGRPWLEVLISVDTAAADPKPVFVAKMPGTTRAKGEVADDLALVGKKLACFQTLTGQWGISTFDPTDSATQFVPYGANLVGATISEDGSKVLFAEKTGYGTVIAGTLDVADGARTQFAETRGKVSFVATNPGVIRIDEGKQATLINADTGAMVDVAAESSARMTGLGLLTWSPKSAPTRARLLEPSRWVPIAVWSGKAEPIAEVTPPVEPKPAKATPPTAPSKPPTKISAAALAAEAAKPKPMATAKTPSKPETTPKATAKTPTKIQPPVTKKPTPVAKSTEKPKKKGKSKPEVEVSVRRRGG